MDFQDVAQYPSTALRLNRKLGSVKKESGTLSITSIICKAGLRSTTRIFKVIWSPTAAIYWEISQNKLTWRILLKKRPLIFSPSISVELVHFSNANTSPIFHPYSSTILIAIIALIMIYTIIGIKKSIYHLYLLIYLTIVQLSIFLQEIQTIIQGVCQRPQNQSFQCYKKDIDMDKSSKKGDNVGNVGGKIAIGKLCDGRVVAVKRLFEHNRKRVEQFMNEVAILSRLRHKNLVPLYGCTTQHGRELLLVYEFISNGTLADHIHGKHSEDGLLTWPIRMRIAVESADALAYLHASEIIHRDVKSSNILLDNNFHVKVADFGLSRLFPVYVTHVSTAPQGTPGYVDPEYYQCYQLSNKSDVYSFGVVLIELISSKPAIDIARNRHEINLANMAITRIHNQALHELIDPSLGYDTDYNVRNMIKLVAELAFSCLQQDNEMRPCMKEVLEILREIENGTDDMDISDDAQLLKNNEPFSLDTVIEKWHNEDTNPNTSG